PAVEEFDAVVAENGAHVRWPEGRDELIGQPPPAEFMQRLAEEGVRPVEKGRVIVATFEPYEKAVLEAIKHSGLELQVIFNKGAVMVLPSGVNKATGLKRVLKQLGIKPEEVAAVGDAENDHAFFEYCGFSAAVANALPALKEHADWVSQRRYGAGVVELIDWILDAGADNS
ncbi:MAG TPA: HAD-IIB family hydrolase, partial [Chthoniobacteraceae bacterium]|nr:HAD-IIB family hydrolase [Chthoniobacteraceae bacterium]